MAEGKSEIVKKYSNDEITVIWKPRTCIHAKKCWDGLPDVFNPEKRPWINIEGALAEKIRKQIDQCPSGALSYETKTEEGEVKSDPNTEINVLENGPLLVHGTLHVTNVDGTKEVKNKTTAFCRCGASENKPYCDGGHTNIGFKG